MLEEYAVYERKQVVHIYQKCIHTTLQGQCKAARHQQATTTVGQQQLYQSTRHPTTVVWATLAISEQQTQPSTLAKVTLVVVDNRSCQGQQTLEELDQEALDDIPS